MRALEPLHVQLQDRWPHRIEWRGRSFTVVEVLATWCVEGRWWQDSGRSGARRRYFRLYVRASRTGELCVEVFHTNNGEWKLWCVAD